MRKVLKKSFFLITATSLLGLGTGCSLSDGDGTEGNPFFDAAATTTSAAATTQTAAPQPAAQPEPQPQPVAAARTPEPASAPVQQAAPAPSSHNDGGSANQAFVFKPVSEGDGNLVILLPARYGGANSMTISGSFGSESGRFVGRTNGQRPTFRFSRPGCGYGGGIRVSANGGWPGTTIQNGCSRVEF